MNSLLCAFSILLGTGVLVCMIASLTIYGTIWKSPYYDFTKPWEWRCQYKVVVGTGQYKYKAYYRKPRRLAWHRLPLSGYTMLDHRTDKAARERCFRHGQTRLQERQAKLEMREFHLGRMP